MDASAYTAIIVTIILFYLGVIEFRLRRLEGWFVEFVFGREHIHARKLG